MKTSKIVCTHVFYKKGATKKEKEELIAMAKHITTSKGCVIKMCGNQVEFLPFMYDSSTSSPLTVEKLIPKPTCHIHQKESLEVLPRLT